MSERVWEWRDAAGNLLESMTASEWKRRFAARLMNAGGMAEIPAIASASDAYQMALEDLSANMDEGLIGPEDAADMDMADWEDDGEELHRQ
jgi:hypothetical protein